jgi:hypothetical protein
MKSPLIFLVSLLTACLLLLTGCTSANTAQRALSGAGYTKVSLTGYRFFGCGEEDLYRDGFEAVGPTGQKVTGVVCGGILKGSTIRLD